MCKFMSALVLRSGDVVCDPEHTDSHEDLIQSMGLRDKIIGQHFVRVEFSPTAWSTVGDLTTWSFLLDEDVRPEWFTDQVEVVTREVLVARVAMMMQPLPGGMMISGCKILTAGYAYSVKGGRVFIFGDAKVGSIFGDAKVGCISDDVKVDSIYGDAKVDHIYGDAKVDLIFGYAKVDSIYGDAKVGSIYGDAKVDSIYGDAKVDHIYGDAKVDHIFGDAKVGCISDDVKVDSIYGDAKVGCISDDAKVGP